MKLSLVIALAAVLAVVLAHCAHTKTPPRESEFPALTDTPEGRAEFMRWFFLRN